MSSGSDSMVCKLRGTAHTRALTLPGAHLADPSGKDRPMREEEWSALAEEALRHVTG